jgi:hypothetical protein
MSDQLMPWQQQKGENKLAYALFKDYLKAGSKRNYEALAQITGLSLSTIKRYGTKWKWRDRIRLYEIYHDTDSSLVERIAEFEEEKFNVRINLSSVCLDLLKTCSTYLRSDMYSEESSLAVSHVKYVKNILVTLKELLRMSDFSVNPSLVNKKVLRDLKLSNIFMSDNQGDNNLSLNDFRNINVFLDAKNENNTEPEIKNSKNGIIGLISDEGDLQVIDSDKVASS